MDRQNLGMFRGLRTSTSFTLLFFSILLILTAFPVTARRTLDYCVFGECGEDLTCVGVDQSTRRTGPCDPTYPLCLCRPIDGLYTECESSSTCTSGEGCGLSPTSGRQLCVSCGVITNSSRMYEHVDPEAGECTIASPLPSIIPETPGPSPSPLMKKQTNEFCSRKDPCRDDLKCVDEYGAKCTKGSTQCLCVPKVNAGLIECEVPDDCTNEKETCALDTRLRQKFCVGCASLAQQHTLKPIKSGSKTNKSDEDEGNGKESGRWMSLDTSNKMKILNVGKLIDNKCKAVKKKLDITVPAYNDGPNGLTFDYCRSDNQCQGDRTCTDLSGFSVQQCQPGNFREICMCNIDLFQACTSSSQCPLGERCAELNGSDQPYCFSAAYLQTKKANQVTFTEPEFVTSPKKAGDGFTGDKCKFDWECFGERRCTHVDGAFGGCAGRKNCICSPLYYRSCKSKRNCNSMKTSDRKFIMMGKLSKSQRQMYRNMETCVHIPGSKSIPFCYSKPALEDHPFLVERSKQSEEKDSVNGKPEAVGGGLTRDGCKNNNECGVGRKCFHMTESTGKCARRRNCECYPTTETDQIQFKSCSTEGECEEGEICAVITDAFLPTPVCMSKAAFKESWKFIYSKFKQPDVNAARPAIVEASLSPDAVHTIIRNRRMVSHRTLR